MKRKSLVFTAPGVVEILEESLPPPAPDQVQVRTLISAISSGTETLVYSGQFPRGMPVDETIPALPGDLAYPLKYGYAAVGEVEAYGSAVDPAWQDRLVFAFEPHQSHFIANPEQLKPLPAGISPEQAVFLANMETALNLVMDGAPLIGENVIVFGQGVVGLLTTALLARFPLGDLLTLDNYPDRRMHSLELGARLSFDPQNPETMGAIRDLLTDGVDLTFELSGSPPALDQAIAVTGYSGRVIIGSWYGQKHAGLDLGGRFHRSRIRLVSSQVSTLAPELTGRWTKARRLELAWEMIRSLQPERLITHHFPLEDAPAAYRLIADHPEPALQVVLTYS